MEPRVLNRVVGGKSEIPALEYKVLPLEKIKIHGEEGKNPSTLKAKIMVGGKPYETTQRFWTSFFAKFGFSDSVFRYYKHQEVFDRICHVKPNIELRFCTDPSSSTALAVSNPKKPVIDRSHFMDIASKYKGTDVKYMKGVAISTYIPASGEREFKIGPDGFRNRFVLETPMDGYGNPSIYLSLLREVCSNGAVAYAPSFRQDISIGDDPYYAISRSLDSFDSDEGYSAIRQRFESSQSSPASLNECLHLFRIFKQLKDQQEFVKAYERVVGDIHGSYGVANLDGISAKKLQLLPAKCKVYDILNLASEVSTHYTDGTDSLKLQAWLGKVISSEYDLEGTDDKKTDFEGVFMKDHWDHRSN